MSVCYSLYIHSTRRRHSNVCSEHRRGYRSQLHLDSKASAPERRVSWALRKGTQTKHLSLLTFSVVTEDGDRYASESWAPNSQGSVAGQLLDPSDPPAAVRIQNGHVTNALSRVPSACQLSPHGDSMVILTPPGGRPTRLTLTPPARACGPEGLSSIGFGNDFIASIVPPDLQGTRFHFPGSSAPPSSQLPALGREHWVRSLIPSESLTGQALPV